MQTGDERVCITVIGWRMLDGGYQMLERSGSGALRHRMRMQEDGWRR